MQEDNFQVTEEEHVDDPTEQAADQAIDDSGKTLEEINEEIEKELEEAIAEEELSREQQLEGEVMEWKEKALRAAADLENYRKRSAREKADAIRYGNQRLLEDMLPVLDNFSMGMMAAEKDAGSMIYMGMQMVQKQLDDFLANQGVQVMEVKTGDDFNPNLHDAISQELSEEVADGQILRVVRKGYKMGERLIRPANVVVAQAAQVAATSGEENTEA